MNSLNLKEKKALIIGTTGKGESFSFGGSDKIKSLKDVLLGLYGNVEIANTFNWKKHPFKTFYKVKKAIKSADDIYVVLSVNGTRFFCPFIIRWARKKNARLFYPMVGIGELEYEVKDDPNYDKITKLIQSKNLWHKGNKKVGNILKKMNAVLVQTVRLQEMCQVFYDLNNVFVFDNIRSYIPNPEYIKLEVSCQRNVRFVYFAALNSKKGANLALEAANKLLSNGLSNFSIDFYGRLSDELKPLFVDNNLPKNLSYKGVCLRDKLNVLSKYDCLIYPSIFVEGMPGTIVDARFSALPIISSSFTFSDELISDGVDGLLFKRGDSNDLASKMKFLIENRQIIPAFSKHSFERCFNCTIESGKEEIMSIIKNIDKTAE